MYTVIYSSAIIIIWFRGHNMIPKTFTFCASESNEESQIQEYNILYLIFTGVSIVAFSVEFSTMFSKTTTHEHAFALRTLLLLVQFTTIITCVTLAFPDATMHVFGVNLCIEAGGRTVFQIIDRFLTVPLMFYITIGIDCTKPRLMFIDYAIIFGRIINGFTMMMPIFPIIPIEITNFYFNIGWQLYNVSCVLLVWSCVNNYYIITASNGVSLSDIFVKQAAHEQLAGCIFLNALLLVVATFKFIMVPFLTTSQSFWIIFSLSMILKLLYPIFTLSGYDDQLSREAVMLQHAKVVCDLERRYLKRNLHEIREPLNVFTIGHPLLRLLISNADLDERTSNGNIDNYLSIIKHAVSYMSKTLNATISGDLVEKCVSIESLLDSVYMCQKVDAESNGITLRTTIEEDVPKHIICDEDRIEHVLMNLVNNSIKFSPRGSTIYVNAAIYSGKSGHVIFSVRDEGVGMSKENVKKLFTPFLQFDSDQIQVGKGTGVGLCMCKNMIQLHGGDIGCQSRQSSDSDYTHNVNDVFILDHPGSIFYFYIPIKSDKVVEFEIKDPFKMTNPIGTKSLCLSMNSLVLEVQCDNNLVIKYPKLRLEPFHHHQPDKRVLIIDG